MAENQLVKVRRELADMAGNLGGALWTRYDVVEGRNVRYEKGKKAVWKIYQISSGLRVKGGFANENAAKEWMDRRGELMDEDFDVEEMDEEEEEEYLENGDEEDNTDLLGETPFAAIREFSDEDDDSDEPRARGASTFDREEELEEGGFTVGDDEDL